MPLVKSSLDWKTQFEAGTYFTDTFGQVQCYLANSAVASNHFTNAFGQVQCYLENSIVAGNCFTHAFNQVQC